jgi:hypothetical protein
MISRSSLDKSDAIHLASRSADSATKPARGRRFRGAVPGHDRQVAFRKPDSPPEFARRHVDQHQVHGPAAKPVLGLRRRLARQRNFMTIEAAHPRPMHRNLATVEADLALRRTPAVADAASAAAVRRAGSTAAIPAVRQKR